VDLIKIIHELREERKKLDAIISSLEQLNGGMLSRIPSTSGRRGRRFMDAEARLEVSRRMKTYWANRREEKEEKEEGGSAG
jgi:hypothetical protein